MNKLLIAVVVLGMFSTGSALTVGFDFDAGYTFHENNDRFFINSSALVNIYKIFYLRTTLADVSFYSGHTQLYIGTGSGIDLMMCSYAPNFAPYGLGGLHLLTGGGSTNLTLRLGVGSEFEINKAYMPFAEVDLDVYRTSTGGHSGTETAVTLKGGIRFK